MAKFTRSRNGIEMKGGHCWGTILHGSLTFLHNLGSKPLILDLHSKHSWKAKRLYFPFQQRQTDLQSWKTVIVSLSGAKGVYACFLINIKDSRALSSKFLFWNGTYWMWMVHLSLFLSLCERTSIDAKMLIFWHLLLLGVVNVLCLWHKSLMFSISKSMKLWQANLLACK